MDPMDPTKRNALRKGLLEFLVLATASPGKVYVADILKRLSDTEFAAKEGTLYPLLSKMRREGLLDYEWQESASGPPRKYYAITGTGSEQLTEFREFWNSLATLIDELEKDHAPSD